MSNHFSGLRIAPPEGDPRLDLTDLYVFPAPGDPAHIVLILNANTFAGAAAFHPDAAYRINVDNDGDAETDVAISFVFSGNVVFATLIDAVGPVRSTVITYINPAVAALLGVVVLNETLTPAMIAGFGLVTLGSVLATRPPRHQADAVPVVTTTG